MPDVKDKMTGKTVASMSYDNKGMAAANKMAADDPGLIVTDGRNRSQQMYEGGGMTGMSMIGRPQYREGGKMKYMGGGKTHGMKKMGDGGMMKKYEDGGKTLKEVDSSKNPGLSKLPKEVRNKMGYMEEGGKAKKGMAKKGASSNQMRSRTRTKKSYGRKNQSTQKMPVMKKGGKTKADFKPHMMYKDGKGVKANTYEKHMSLKKQGYGHSMKKMQEGGKMQMKSNMYMKEGGKTYLEIMQEGVKKQKDVIKKGVKKQKKFDVESGIKNIKKFDVDSGVGKTKPAAKKRTEFQSAFRKARNAGKKVFTFKGKKYNTKLRK